MTRILIAVVFVISIDGYGQKIEYNLSVPGDTTQNYYVTVSPKGKIKGSLVLLPGFGELPKETLIDCDIHKYATEAGYLTIIPALGDRFFFYMDNLSHQKLNQFIAEVFQKYNLNEKSFFIGGASLGGTMAVQYTERAYLNGSNLKKPAGVFGLDPPLDIERLYHSMSTTNRPKKNPISIQEDNYFTKRIQQEFKTEPKANPEYFWKVSPFALTDPNHSSLRSILKVPIRIYNEPDINWYIENRNVDYNHMNVIDSAAMINWLKSLGNTHAELIITSGKGYRIRNKMRHPHSWTIADGKELVTWMDQNVHQ